MPSTTNFGWTTPADTDLVKDGAAAIRTLGNGIDTSFLDLKGGTSGQILAKNSNTDLDFVWVANDQGDITAVTAGTGISGGGTSGAVTITNSMATEITAKGDLIVGTGSAAFDNLPAGTNGHVLTADSTVSPTGLKWAAPAAGGKVLQVIQDTDSTFRSNATTTFQTTGLSQAITPSSASSKILVMASVTYRVTDEAAANSISFRLRRASTTVISDVYVAQKAASVYLGTRYTMIYLDDPATTSATTYELQFMNPNGTANALVQADGADNMATMILMEIGA